jgi:cellulose synthase operon protein C
MNNFWHIIFLTSVILSITACGTAKKDLMVKDLAVEDIKYEAAKTTASDRESAINNYKNFIQNTVSKDNYGTALRRLADLELEVSEDKNAQSSEELNNEGQRIMLSSIEHYDTYLETYPGHAQNDLILYQLAKAHSYNGDYEKALVKMDFIVKEYPNTKYIDEIQFRRGEILFVMGDYSNAELAYTDIVRNHPNSAFFENALYKLGWSQFKKSRYFKALSNYLHLLDRKQAEGKLTANGLAKNISRADQDFINDTLRVISLALSYKSGTNTIELLFSAKTNRTYEALLYRQLGDLYISKDRATDAANVYLSYSKTHPLNPLAAEFHSLAITAYASGNFHDLVLSTKESFVIKYGVGTHFWGQQKDSDKEIIKPHLKKHIHELANHYHARALKSKKAKDYSLAALWYKKFLSSFPGEKELAGINFLLAETLFDAKKYNDSLAEYEKTAYNYPLHKQSAEAGYAALLTYNKLIELAHVDKKIQVKYKATLSAIRFSKQFPNDKHAPAVITKTAEELFEIRDYKQAAEFARRVIDRKDIKDKALRKTAWTVYAHSHFELKDFAAAELAYIEVLKRTSAKDKRHTAFSDKLAASIYKQAEQQRDATHYELAAFHFLRIGKIVPTSSIRATAEYDAATMFIRLEKWVKATETLEAFRRHFPSHRKFSKGITEKLALTYTNTGQFAKAAREISILASLAINKSDKQKLTWKSAEMYAKAGDVNKANNIYIKYIKSYPSPFSQNIEAHLLVSDYYLNNKSYKKWGQWLRKTVKVEKRGGKYRTTRTNFIAATATLQLTRPLVRSFRNAKLSIPLKKSLKIKKRLMTKALKAYAEVMSYKIAELTTESTYQVAEVYNQFAKALMSSQRPKGLSEEELEQYDILLEEQAYPFEEKAIDIHGSNIRRTKDGIYDKWVKKSLKLLAILQPIRYAKTEKVEDYAAIAN